ncbi:MAG: SDR family oxidoreductase [Heteroscytonema crispum UTEX LB 1556]
MMQRFAKVNPQMVEQMREIYPIGRFGQPEEIEAAVVWLCLDRAFFVTGQSLAIDGGYVIQ